MSKRKRFSVGDVVDWLGDECLVTSLDPFKVIPTSPGPRREFSVLSSHVFAAEDWRALLRPNDEVEFYFEQFWIHSRVHAVNPLVIQPTFTRVLIASEPHRIRRARSSIPVQFEMCVGPYDRFDQVLVAGEWYVVDKCLSASVLTMDRHYFAYAQISGSISRMDAKTLVGTIPFEHGTGFTDSDSILDSLPATKFRDCSRYACHELWRRSVCNLDQWVSSSYDNGDFRGARDLMACADHLQKFEMARWFEWRWCSIPYLKFDFSPTEVRVYWTRVSPLPSSRMLCYVTPVLRELFVPEETVLSLPGPSERLLDWQVPVVDEMCLHEDRNVCASFCDAVGPKGLMFSHFGGFLLRQLPVRHGGVLSAGAGLGKTWMLLDLVRRRPLKTLVVVPLCVLSHWVGVCAEFGMSVSVWHGSKKDSSGRVVLTTCRTLSRGLPSGSFERLVLDEAQTVKLGSSSMRLLCSLDIRTRWYVSTSPRFKEACVFLRVFPFCLSYQPSGACEMPSEVTLARDIPLQVTYETVPMRYPACYSELELSNSDRNVFRYDPRLVSPELVHERVLVHKNTLENVKASLSHELDIGSCPVCLEEIVDPLVTQCGHAVCSDCGSRLMELKSNCPMCRDTLYPLTSISDKEEKTLMINGRSYRERDTSGGNMWEVLKSCVRGKTLFVTRSPVLHTALGHLDVRLLRECVGVRFDCDTIVLVDSYISESERARLLDRVRGVKSAKVRFVSIV